jgi:nucleotide-binding universal stress UspA family protein
MFEKIIVATDGSKTSLGAAVTGIEIAKLSNSKVIAVYVADVARLAYLSGCGDFSDSIRKCLQEEGENAIRDVRKIAKVEGVSCEEIIVEGDPGTELVRISQEYRVGLLVIGSIGRSGLKSSLLGSVAEKVVRYSKVPVLIVPERSLIVVAERH